LKVKVGTK